jgi:hypothetical protein
MSTLDLSTASSEAAGDVGSIDEFARRLAGGARDSLANPSRLYGVRGEAMFRAVLVALGDFKLLVEEDEGEVYYDEAGGAVKPPDYRVVDSEGHELLIEVKTVAPTDRTRHSIAAAEVQAMQRYGELTGAPMLIAHYWSSMNVWTLVDLDQLHPKGARFELELTDALKANQMGRFGDRTIGTVPPLALRLQVEEIAERTEPDTAKVVIKGAQIVAGGKAIVDKVEERIAWMLFRFGRWPVEMPAELDTDGKLASFSLEAAPRDDSRADVERQGFAVVGELSSMYSAMFNEMTLDDEGTVRRLDHHSEPGELGSLIPDDYFERSDRHLALWVLHLHPAVDH